MVARLAAPSTLPTSRLLDPVLRYAKLGLTPSGLPEPTEMAPVVPCNSEFRSGSGVLPWRAREMGINSVGQKGSARARVQACVCEATAQHSTAQHTMQQNTARHRSARPDAGCGAVLQQSWLMLRNWTGGRYRESNRGRTVCYGGFEESQRLGVWPRAGQLQIWRDPREYTVLVQQNWSGGMGKGRKRGNQSRRGWKRVHAAEF